MASYIKIVVFSSIVFYNITKSLGEYVYAYNKSSISMERCYEEIEKYEGYECSDGTCIRQSQYCNGIVDCEGTAEDEIYCKKCPTGSCLYDGSYGLCDTGLEIPSIILIDHFKSLLENTCDVSTQVNENTINCTGKSMIFLPCLKYVDDDRRKLILNENLFGLYNKLSDSSFQYLDRISALKLERNQIRYLPSKVFQYGGALEELSLANNQIQEMDNTAFRYLYNLMILRLNRNNIKNLTSNVFQDLSNLKELHLSENAIEHLDENIFGNLSRLLDLYLDWNEITTLPKNIFRNLSSLQNLYLSRNRIENLDESIFQNLRILYTIGLDYNNLTTLPPNVFQELNNLDTLLLNNNRIAYLDGNVFHDLRNLGRLHLQSNVIASLSPNAFENLQNLKMLALSVNQIMDLHETTFHHLSKLTWLYLTDNKIQRLAAHQFRNLTSLQVLDLGENQIQKLDEIVFANLRNLIILWLEGNVIEDLPPKVFHDLENLLQLTLQNNRISKLDEMVFRNLKSLSTLDLGGNYISYLSANVFQGLTTLDKLLLSKNQIKSMDEMVFRNLHLLTTLNLAANHISNLPGKVFNDLTNLCELSLDGNQIQHLDEAIFQNLHKLETLSISGNHITHLPANLFKNLKELRSLDLGNNAIRHLPNILYENQLHLTMLNMRNNRLIALPAYILKNSRHLNSLMFEGNAIESVDEFSFSGLSQLSQLYLQNNTIGDVSNQIFRDMKKLELLAVDEYRFCCLRKDVKNCTAPIDDFSSCEDLMKNTVLRIFVWIIGIIAICANIFVIVVRIKYQNARTNKVNLFLIVNLAISDFIMGVYLVVIATIDQIYRGEYYLHDLSWRRSYLCDFVGVLSTFSSELTVFILTVVSVDRLLSIMFPWRTVERGLGRTKILMITVWILAAVISLVPHQIFQIPYFKNFYGRSGVCLALHITKEKPNGWEYSVSVFIFLNALSFAVIAVAYALMYYRASGKFRKTITSTNQSSDTVMAFRMTLLVLADAACWIPIIAFGVKSLMGYASSPDTYTWIAVFVLPLNAALNPILYTISSIPLMVEWKSEKCPANNQPHIKLLWRGLDVKSIQK